MASRRFLITSLLATPLMVLALAIPARAQEAEYCREYNSTVDVGGRPQPVYGTACRQPDGSWHIRSQQSGTPEYGYTEPVAPAPAPVIVQQREVIYVDDDPFYDPYYDRYDRWGPRFGGYYGHGFGPHRFHDHGFRHRGWRGGSGVALGFGF